MNLTEIQDLIKFVSKSGVSEVEIEQKEFKITIKSDGPKRRGKAAQQQQHFEAQMVPQMVMPHNQMPQQPVQMHMPPQSIAAPAPAAAPVPAAEAPAEESSKYVEVKSPMIGTFYRSPGPDKPMFAEVGDQIKEGQTVCIIEAMKLFNEIEAEVSGKIVKILVDDNTPVEFDQPLFLVDPS